MRVRVFWGWIVLAVVGSLWVPFYTKAHAAFNYVFGMDYMPPVPQGIFNDFPLSGWKTK
jgi:hypothetical protein